MIYGGVFLVANANLLTLTTVWELNPDKGALLPALTSKVRAFDCGPSMLATSGLGQEVSAAQGWC